MILLLALLLLASSAYAQEDVPASDHWAFSAFFGTGWYDIVDGESVFIFHVPFSQIFRTSSFEAGNRIIGVKFHYPVTLGLHNISELDQVTSLDNFGTMAFTPGIELEIPVTEKWYLRPLLHAGWGKETDDGDSAWIYYGGIRSRYTPGGDGLDWSLLNGLFYSGFSGSRSGSESVSAAMVGAEFHHPLSSRFSTEDELQLNWHLTYSWLFDEAKFEISRGLSQSIRDQWELGFALAPRGRSFKFWFLEFDQMGLSFQTSSNGDYRAVTVNVSSPFK